MSGNDGIRGYIIQTLICILEALETDNKWLSVTLEPLDESEKVDILWKYENNIAKLSQVKSSKNPFEFSDAKKWSSELESKSPNAFDYELILVGNPATKLLKEKKIGKVNIVFKPLDFDILNDQASTKIDKYYERKGKTKISSSVRELIIGNLNTRFGTSSILGKEIKREQFDEQLLDWIIAIQKEAERNPLAVFSVQDSEDNDNTPFSHRVTKKILELIGWNQFGENYKIESFNEKLSEVETHSIDFYGDFESKLKEKCGDFLILSSAHDIQYPSSTKFTINKYLNDTSKVFDDLKKKNKIPLKLFEATDYYSILFWFSTDNQEISKDFVDQIKGNYKDSNLNEDILYFFVDNKKANFLVRSIITAKNYRDNIPVKFLYPITESNQSPEKIGKRDKILPPQYINSSVIPIIKEDSEKISFLLFCSDSFSSNTLKKLIWLSIKLTSGFCNEYIIYFPDYNPSLNKNEVAEVVRSFNDNTLREKVEIKKYNDLDFGKLDTISNVKVITEKDETYQESKNDNSSTAFKHLNEVFINTLPYGDILKPFFKTDAITPTDLKIFLSKKGIFLKSGNKKKIINLMTTLLFSSNELEEFKSLIDVKDRTVHTTEEFLHVKQDQSLKEVFNKAQINLDNITDELNTKIINTESMFFKQSDHDKNEYTLSLITEVKDPTSSLSVNTIWGKSEVIVKKVDNKVVIVSINSITRDDKHIANRIVKTLNEEFQRINFIKDERIKVLFKNFKSNAERVNFLLSFSNCSSSRILKSAVIQSIKFKFDNNAEIPKRYKDKADTDSIINYSDGKHLHTLDELSNESAKDSILLEEIEINYKFELHNIKNGKYKVTYNFSDALKNKDEYNGVFKSNPVLTMRKSIKGMKDIEKLKQELSKEIDRLKLEKIQLFKII